MCVRTFVRSCERVACSFFLIYINNIIYPHFNIFTQRAIFILLTRTQTQSNQFFNHTGSMRGQRKDIAKHVVSNILETLTTNDFVNILKFSERIESVVKCFNETLVPATLDNVRSLNAGMESIETEKIANYSQALISAFDILQSYRTSDEGAGCNQAIMLISDGVPHDFNDTFRQYNWPNETYRHVRLFTYLIGSEVPDFQLIKEMACINQGYYVHLSVPSEVREQVLRYIPVMARPLVLGKHKHPIIWSHVYADIIVSIHFLLRFFIRPCVCD